MSSSSSPSFPLISISKKSKSPFPSPSPTHSSVTFHGNSNVNSKPNGNGNPPNQNKNKNKNPQTVLPPPSHPHPPSHSHVSPDDDDDNDDSDGDNLNLFPTVNPGQMQGNQKQNRHHRMFGNLNAHKKNGHNEDSSDSSDDESTDDDDYESHHIPMLQDKIKNSLDNDGTLPLDSPSSSSPSPSPSPNLDSVYFRSDFSQIVLLNNFSLLGWKKSPSYSSDNPSDSSRRDWHFYWGSVSTIKSIFNPDLGGYRLTENQIVNHFPNYYELTRKDLMVKNIKRYRKELESQTQQSFMPFNINMGNHRNHMGNPMMSSAHCPLSLKDREGNYVYLDIFPTTFILPSDFSLFVDQFKRNPNSVWIMKPNSKSQGYGITIISKMQQIKQMKIKLNQNTNTNNTKGNGGNTSSSSSSSSTSSTPSPSPSRELFVVSRYIGNPLLIGSKKFDLRLYVLVTTYRPLRCYLYDESFARFCNVPYSNDSSSFDNNFIHLTNVAIQKEGKMYNSQHGNKWSTENLKLYLQSRYPGDKVKQLFHSIHFIIIHSLKAVQNVMVNDKHCFECYGYDLLIDDTLRPWLLEINASPSLSVTTAADKSLKMNLIRDILRVVIPPQFPSNNGNKENQSHLGTAWNSHDVKIGGFQIIYDETMANEKDKEREREKIFVVSPKTSWKSPSAFSSSSASISDISLRSQSQSLSQRNRNSGNDTHNNNNNNNSSTSRSVVHVPIRTNIRRSMRNMTLNDFSSATHSPPSPSPSPSQLLFQRQRQRKKEKEMQTEDQNKQQYEEKEEEEEEEEEKEEDEDDQDEEQDVHNDDDDDDEYHDNDNDDIQGKRKGKGKGQGKVREMKRPRVSLRPLASRSSFSSSSPPSPSLPPSLPHRIDVISLSRLPLIAKYFHNLQSKPMENVMEIDKRNRI